MHFNLAEQIKKQYPKGTRIVLDRMGEDPRPIEPGTRGTVLFVDDIGTVHVAFDNGRQLGLIIGEDDFHTEPEKSIETIIEEAGRGRDAFWIDPVKRTAEEIYYNPDSESGGQFVINRFTFSQIERAEKHAGGDPDLFFTYLETVCCQELVDIGKDPALLRDTAAAFERKADITGTTADTMDVLISYARAAKEQEKSNGKRGGRER